MNIIKSKSWIELLAHKKRIDNTNLEQLFKNDPNRFKKFSIENCGLLYDFSKQKIDKLILKGLLDLAKESEVKQHIQDLFAGKRVNVTEDRPALHMNLRMLETTSEIQQVRKKTSYFVSEVHANKKIKNVLSLGIGGSELGPLMACEALQNFKVNDLKIHFISNVDGDTLSNVLNQLSPEATICLINSKTFTTIETMLNAKYIKNWFEEHLGNKSVSQHMFAITANYQKAKEFGIPEENIFTFWDWVGGRYSIWSAVGLPLELMLGTAQFNEFLTGARIIDEHFINSDFELNIPVIMALLGIWNINFMNFRSLLIMPYIDGLRNFPAYLQQLEMESNGKSAINSGGYADYNTAPVIWGGIGCNGQHAYMQLLHQGTQMIPVDFIAAVNSHNKLKEHQDLLLTSCLSQSKALMHGTSENLVQEKRCFGDRPSSTILFPKLTPKILGSLIALYEHKVFVQGVIWQIQSFDQFGVELGKKIINELLMNLQKGVHQEALDSSTEGLLDYIENNTKF